MGISMHGISAPIFIRQLRGLAIVTRKAQALYAEKKYDEATLLSYRLYPDMYSFARQVRSATNHPCAFVSLLAGVEPPKYEDNEKSLADLLARIDGTVAFLKGINPGQIDGTEDKSFVLKMRERDVPYTGLELLQNRTLPNFYFHCTTAYDILRHNGVEIGKRHFMGND